jgi:hypothetical protein
VTGAPPVLAGTGGAWVDALGQKPFTRGDRQCRKRTYAFNYFAPRSLHPEAPSDAATVTHALQIPGQFLAAELVQHEQMAKVSLHVEHIVNMGFSIYLARFLGFSVCSLLYFQL